MPLSQQEYHKIEKYLSDVKNPKTRNAITRLRLSNHNLVIETGRHKKMDLDMRICPLCNHGIEDEVHFLFICDIYKTIRDRTLENYIRNTNFNFYTNNEKLEFLMLNIDNNIAKYIYNCFELRTFLTQKPRKTE